MWLEKNPHYWDRDHVAIRTIGVYPTEETNTLFTRYELGELDFITEAPPLAVERLIELKEAGGRPDYYRFPVLGTYYYEFNCERAPLSDARVRRALDLALDKKEICVKVGRARQVAAQTLVPMDMPNYGVPNGLARDPEKARRLLAEAGFPNGRGFPELTLLYNTSETHKFAAALAQACWKRELGIEVALNNVEWKTFLERRRDRKYDIARAGWYGDYVDPNTFLDMYLTGGGNNNAGWSNADYDGLIAGAAREINPTRRAELLRRAETILVEQELPILPIYYYVSSMLVRSHIKGFHPNLRGRILFQDLSIEGAGGGTP